MYTLISFVERSIMLRLSKKKRTMLGIRKKNIYIYLITLLSINHS